MLGLRLTILQHVSSTEELVENSHDNSSSDRLRIIFHGLQLKLCHLKQALSKATMYEAPSDLPSDKALWNDVRELQESKRTGDSEEECGDP